MWQKRQNILLLAQDFVDKCNANNLWYSLSGEALLGAIRHSGFLPWAIKFEVMMTYRDYNRLKVLFPKNIIDSAENKDYKNLKAIWIWSKNYSTWRSVDIFLEINILVPTTLKKVAKYSSFISRSKKYLQRYPRNLNSVINQLLEVREYQGYLQLSNKLKPLNYYWYQTLPEKRVIKEINGHSFYVCEQYHKILEDQFGKNYMQALVPKYWYEYLTPLKKERIE